MKKVVFGFILIGAVVVLANVPLMAHHSFAAEFDAKKPVTMTGTVTKVDWTNPHVWFFINVKDDAGKTSNWGFEMGPPHLLQGQGWSRTTMKIGDTVTVSGTLAKNGTNRGNARSVMTPDGKRLGAASSEGQPAVQP